MIKLWINVIFNSIFTLSVLLNGVVVRSKVVDRYTKERIADPSVGKPIQNKLENIDFICTVITLLLETFYQIIPFLYAFVMIGKWLNIVITSWVVANAMHYPYKISRSHLVDINEAAKEKPYDTNIQYQESRNIYTWREKAHNSKRNLILILILLLVIIIVSTVLVA